MRHFERTSIALAAGLLMVCVGPGCSPLDPVPSMQGASDSGSTTSDASTSQGTTTQGTTTQGPATTTADSSGSLPPEADYYPLVDGATWTYQHTTADMMVWDEVVVMRETTFDGAQAFEIEDNPGTNGEVTISTLMRNGGQVLRVHKVVSLAGAPVETVDYDPGFLRIDHAWQGGESLVWEYLRSEYDAAGVLVDQSNRSQIFTVESLSTEVTVPAGTFDCIQFTRERLDTGETKRYWFADGVGKIKHETLATGAVEELTEYSVP